MSLFMWIVFVFLNKFIYIIMLMELIHKYKKHNGLLVMLKYDSIRISYQVLKEDLLPDC